MKLPARGLLFTVLACCLWGLVWSAEQPPAKPAAIVTDLPLIGRTIHDALQSRDFAAAIKEIDASLAKKPVEADYLTYLKARAQYLLGQLEPALVTIDLFEKSYPRSPWLSRVRFSRAQVYVKQKNFQKAATVYKEETERLLAQGRRDELTGIYLELADQYFEGTHLALPGGQKQPDYAQALASYLQALQMKPSLALRQKIELRIARCQLELGQHAEAIASYQTFIKNYAEITTRPGFRVPPAQETEARYYWGQALLNGGQPAEARKIWQDLLTSPAAKEAGGEFVSLASYRLGATFGMPAPAQADLELGVGALQKFVATYPKHPLAAQAIREIAQAYLQYGRHDQAVAVLRALAENKDVAATHAAAAWRMLGQALLAQQKYDAAIEAWREFLDRFPTDSQWSDVQRQIIDAEFARAAELRQKKEFAAARKAWETFLNKYPLDDRARLILLEFGRMKYEAALEQKKSLETARAEGKAADPVKEPDAKAVAPKAPDDANPKPAAEKPADDKPAGEKALPAKPVAELPEEVAQLFRDAIADWTRLVSKFPNSSEASLGALLIGITLEDQLGLLNEALEAYKKVQGPQQGAAQQRIANLTAKQLRILTERKFRSNEKARIRVQTRNLEAVTVKVYRIDMADYFRKLHQNAGVESLDIALIDPDELIEHKVAGYEQYRQISEEIELPIDGPGVTAVVVASETLEATTMVVVSDIDLIVKSSRNELFVFAQDVLKGQPAEAVSLAISDGTKTITEGKTDKDGIYRAKLAELKTIDRIAVFGVRDSHPATDLVSLQGLQFSVGLSNTGYLYTDRTTYRAGQPVQLKGLIRWVESDRYVYKAGEKYQLDIYDPRGRVLQSSKITLGEFGTFAHHFVLPGTTPQGNCRVHLFQPGREQSYETSFLVQDYQLEPVQLSIDLPKKDYYRGEAVQGKISLKYYYGTPIAGRPIRYQLGGDRWIDAITDQAGEVRFDLSTQRFSETQPLALIAQFNERSLAVSETIFLATKGFDIAVSTGRRVYIAGETFDATVNVKSPTGDPVGTNLKLELIEILSQSGRDTERVAQSYEVKSDPKSGEVRQTVRIERGGRYLLRATAKDQFEQLVSGASQPVWISGEEDQTRLRILAEKHSYQVGDEGTVQLHWRNRPALALVTFEGAEILGYRLLTLKTGANPLPIRFEDLFAPNFHLSVSVIDGHRFHTADSDFDVTRKLLITMLPEKTKTRPGEPLQVQFKVTDPQGRPVSAELAVSLVQKNLLDLFPDRTLAVDQAFNGRRRQRAIRSSTTCTFRYEPATRSINSLLLAETDREKVVEEERLSRERFRQVPGLTTAAPARVEDLAVPAPAFGNFSDVLSATDGAVSDAEAGELDAVELKQEQLGEMDGSGTERGVQDKDQLLMLGVPPNGPQGAAFGGGLGGGMDPQAGRPDLKASRKSGAKEKANGTFGKRSHVASDKPAQNQLGVSTHDFDSEWHANGAILLRADDSKAGQADSGRKLSRFGEPQSLSRFYFDSNTTWGRANLNSLSNSTVDYYALNGRGEWQVITGLPVNVIEQVAKEGLQIVPGGGSGETGYWNPTVITDKQGQATILFRLPDQSTQWRLHSRGIGKDSLAGQAETIITTQKALFAELKTPQVYTQGDQGTVLVEVHHSAEKGGEIEVQFTVKRGEKTTSLKKTLSVKKPGVEELEFPVEVGTESDLELTVTLKSGMEQDVVTRSIPVRASGLPVFITRSGAARQGTTIFIDRSEQPDMQQPVLELTVGPTGNRMLIDAVAGAPQAIWADRLGTPAYSELERAVSDVIGGVAVLKSLGASRDSDSPEALSVIGKIQSGLSLMISSQRDDGGWNWSRTVGEDRGSDRYMTSRVVWALSSGRQAGFPVPQPTIDAGVAHLQGRFAAAGETDVEGKAILLHGLAEAGAADFAFANRMYRSRNSLSASGLVHVALALLRMDQKSMAGELLTLAQAKLPSDPALVRERADIALTGCIPWMRSGVELRGLYLLALCQAGTVDDKTQALVDWLMAARVGSRWLPEKANGPVIAALAEYSSRARFAAQKYELTVYANEKQVAKWSVDPARDDSRTLRVPAEMLIDGKQQKIQIDMEGRGEYRYSAVLSGTVPADKVKNVDNNWHFERYYEPANREQDGEVIPRGFGVLAGPVQFYRNPLTQLPLGERGEVTIYTWRDSVTGSKDEQLDYLVLTEPLPAGVSVLKESIQGQFDRYEIEPGRITFYLGDRPHPGQIRFTIVGYVPGQYKNLPSTLRSYYEPGKLAVAAPLPLDVLARGKQTVDQYRLTPQELYEIGKRLIAKRDYERAATHLEELFTKFRLQDNIYREVVQWLLETSLAAGDHARIVQYFEIIKEKFSDIEVPFESILKVGQAYLQLGEYERAYLVYRATGESSFLTESQIAGFLDGQGQFLRSVKVMERLLREYPAENYIGAAHYALAQELFQKASVAAQDEKLRIAGITRVTLITSSIQMLEHFLTNWPNDPAADQAGFALANGWLELERFDQVIQRAELYAERYPQSPLLDSFWYLIGYSQFANGQHAAAVEMVKKVAELKRVDPATGVEIAATNKWQAIYILGQIFHSLGQPANAVQEYEKVKDKFPDALEAIDFFLRKEVTLDEVTTVKPGDAVQVPLKFRNIAAVTTKVYRIDLLKFGLLQRNLSQITAINLAGIRPYHESTVKLGDGLDYRDRTQTLELPLKEVGAYLVVCQGENLYTTGLVLVSPLSVEIQEEKQSGRVRVTVRDVVAGSYASGVHVKVIGSQNENFVSGETDLRGVFIADGRQGKTTVLARRGKDQYAFFRGTEWLGAPVQPVPNAPPAPVQEAAPQQPPAEGKGEVLLEQLRSQNRDLNDLQLKNYRGLLQNKSKGVKVESTK